MAGIADLERRILREQAFSLLDRGEAVGKVAEALGVSASTVRRWRREKKADAGSEAVRGRTPPRGRAVEAMLRAEAPAVARVLLDLAKEGDVRAAGLVVRLLGNTLGRSEVSDDTDESAAAAELERELRSLPPAVVSEIVGLLAQADPASADGSRGSGAPKGGGDRGPGGLPWQEEDPPPD
jgi:transposase-like protein